jgi:hypothetical protein
MDEVTHTILPNNGGWGGTALGAGVGGLLGSWLGNGGFGGLGYRGAGAAVGYDTGALNGIQQTVNGIQQQIANADRDLLIQTSGQNQFVGNLINSTGDAIVGAVNAGARDTQAGIFQNTLAQTQNQAATNLAMSNGFGGLNLNIASQGAQSRLQAQELASQQKDCCCQVLRAIEQEGCANRELQREIQTQALRDVLTNTQAENAALKAQLFQTNAMAAQTAAIINALKPTTATAG